MLRMLRRAGGLIAQTARESMSDGCPDMAAALAYSTVFSLPPLLVLLMLIVGAVVEPATVERLLAGQVGSLLGPEGGEQVSALIRNASRPDIGGVAAVFGIGAFLLGASAAFAQLQSALNRAWQVAPDPARGGLGGFLVKRAVSFAMILVLGFLLLVSLAFSALLAAVGDALATVTPEGVSGALLRAVNVAFSFVAIGLLFATIFSYVPDAVIRWRDALVGGTFTAVLFTLGKTLIGAYLGRSDVGSAYGAAGSLAVALLWIYYTALITLVGAEFTQVWARERGQAIVPEPGAVRVIRTHDRARQPLRAGRPA
jgi:membrane protein